MRKRWESRTKSNCGGLFLPGHGDTLRIFWQDRIMHIIRDINFVGRNGLGGVKEVSGEVEDKYEALVVVQM